MFEVNDIKKKDQRKVKMERETQEEGKQGKKINQMRSGKNAN